MVVVGCRGVQVLVGPTQKDLADGGLVLGRQVGVDPIHGQGETLAPPARPVGGGEVKVPEGLARCNTLCSDVHDVHQQAAGPLGVVVSCGRVVFDQRHKGEQLGIHLGGVLVPGVIATVLVGHDASVHIRLGAGGQDSKSVAIHRIAVRCPGPQPGKVLGAQPQARMAGNRRNGCGASKVSRPHRSSRLCRGEQLAEQ